MTLCGRSTGLSSFPTSDGARQQGWMIAHARSILPCVRRAYHRMSIVSALYLPLRVLLACANCRILWTEYLEISGCPSRTACERCVFLLACIPTGASPSGRCTGSSTGESHGQDDIRSSTIQRPRKCNMVGHWAPTSKWPAFGAWRATSACKAGSCLHSPPPLTTQSPLS